MVVHNFKCVVIGDSGVGKTSLLTRFVKEEFRGTSGTRSTISAAFLERRVELGDGHAAQLEIWDTAGQERFRSLNTPMYYRGAAGAILVYDATDAKSFSHVPGWYSQLRMMGEPRCVVALCASKLDLADETDDAVSSLSAAANESSSSEGGSDAAPPRGSRRAVKAADASAFAEANNIPVFRETSAKTGHNVEDLFRHLARVMVQAKLADGGVSTSSAGGAQRKHQRDGSVKLEMPPSSRHNSNSSCC